MVRLINPGLRASYLRPSYSYQRTEDRETLAEGLTRAGLAE